MAHTMTRTSEVPEFLETFCSFCQFIQADAMLGTYRERKASLQVINLQVSHLTYTDGLKSN